MQAVEVRFWSKVAIGSPDECWEWQRYRKRNGYGQFRLPGRTPQTSSRVAWVLTYGEISTGLMVCHKCDNRPCCNPAHLFLGTAADNNADMRAKGRAAPLPAPRPEHSFAAWTYSEIVEGVRHLSDDDLRLAAHLHGQGVSCRQIAKRLGVSHTTISRLLNGTHWRDYLAA